MCQASRENAEAAGRTPSEGARSSMTRHILRAGLLCPVHRLDGGTAQSTYTVNTQMPIRDYYAGVGFWYRWLKLLTGGL